MKYLILFFMIASLFSCDCGGEEILIGGAPVQADLIIHKDDGSIAYTPGDTILYKISVINNGPNDVRGATVTDKAPAGTEIVSWHAEAFGAANIDNTSGAGDLLETIDIGVGAGDSIVFTVAVLISPDFVGDLINTATVMPPADVTDPEFDNNRSHDINVPRPMADLTINKTDNSESYTPGTPVIYTITATNKGPNDVTGAIVKDAAPSGTTITSWTANGVGGFRSGIGNINDTVNLPKDGEIIYTVTLNVPSNLTGDLINTATIMPPVGVDDPAPDNNQSEDRDVASPMADLTITKDDGSAVFTPGTTIVYTITVENDGPSDVIGALVTDTAPMLTTIGNWVVEDINGSRSGSGDINDSVNLPAGGSITYTVPLEVSIEFFWPSLTNTATVNAPMGITDRELANNAASDTNTN